MSCNLVKSSADSPVEVCCLQTADTPAGLGSVLSGCRLRVFAAFAPGQGLPAESREFCWPAQPGHRPWWTAV